MAAKCGRFILGFIVICTLHFSIPRLMPGSPVFAILGPDVIGMSQKQYITLEAELGLHDPLLIQFVRHFKNIFVGDFGFSYFFHQPVKNVLVSHLTPTLLLLLPSVLLSSFMACILGALAGRFSGYFWDWFFTAITLGGFSMALSSFSR